MHGIAHRLSAACAVVGKRWKPREKNDKNQRTAQNKLQHPPISGWRRIPLDIAPFPIKHKQHHPRRISPALARRTVRNARKAAPVLTQRVIRHLVIHIGGV
ncbi:hypothetical protein [Pandoraea norimbergensis]